MNAASWYRKYDQFILGTAGILLVTTIWQMASVFGWVNSLFLSSPSDIFKTVIRQSTEGVLWSDFRTTIIEFVISFVMSVVFGVLAGLLMGWFNRVEYTMDPFVWFFYSTPLIAFYPLFVIWFGLGFNTVIMMGFFLAVIPIAINTFSGVKGTNPILIRAARSFGASNRQILFKIAFPSALPLIITGWKLGVERVLIGVIVGEMFSSNAGLGFRISYYGARLQTTNLFVPLVLVVLFGLVLTQLLRLWENKLFGWQK